MFRQYLCSRIKEILRKTDVIRVLKLLASKQEVIVNDKAIQYVTGR